MNRIFESVPSLVLVLVFAIAASVVSAHPSEERFRRLHGIAGTLADAGSLPPPELGWWYGFRNGFQNRGVSAVNFREVAESQHGRRPWTHATRGLIWGTPVVDREGNVYVGSADKVFYSLTAAGQLRWSYTLPDSGDSLVDSAATLTPWGLVVVPGGDGHLHALEMATGKLAWKFAAHHAGDHEGGVVVNSFEGNATLGPDGNLYAGSDNGHFYSIDPHGRERWSFKTGMMIWSAPAFDPAGKWLAFGSLDKHLYVLECATGKRIASFKGSAEFKASPAIDEAGNLYAGNSDFYVRSFALGKDFFGRPALKLRWAFLTGGEVYSSPAIAGDSVLFGSHDGFLYRVGLDGKLRWRYGVYSRISGSPLVTRDGVVIVGAKNGKLYAIELETGKRVWSFKTAPGLRKVNLDSSPAIGPDGRIFVGSYDGRLYSVPLEFPLQNSADPRCDVSPGNDIPDFGPGVPANGGTIRFTDANGRFHADAPAPIGPEAPLEMRLVVHRKGEYIPNSALAVTGLSVSVEPPTPIDAVVASDSYSLNVFPKTFWTPGVQYRLTIKGRWFERKNPFVDMLKWWNLPSFETVTKFTVRPAEGELPAPAPGRALRYSIGGMYISQPELLDTLIPAAVEGQAFIVSTSVINRQKRTLGVLVLPGYPRPEGIVLRPAPEKVFALNGRFEGDSIRLEGAFKMAAMGGEFPMSPLRIFARLTEGGLADGRLHGTAPVLAIKGNGSTYTGLSWSAIDDLSDARLRLQAVGSFQGSRLPEVDVPVAREALRWVDRTSLEAELRCITDVEGEHLLTAAVVDEDAGTVAQAATVKLAPHAAGARVRMKVTGLDRATASGAGRSVRLFFDGEPLAP